jgi:hypothetical protein
MTVSRIGRDAGEETMAGLREPVPSTLKVAGTRTFVAPLSPPPAPALVDAAGLVDAAVRGATREAVVVAAEWVEPPQAPTDTSPAMAPADSDKRLKVLTTDADKSV